MVLVPVEVPEITEVMAFLDYVVSVLGDSVDAIALRARVCSILASSLRNSPHAHTIAPFIPAWVPLRRKGLLASHVAECEEMALSDELNLWAYKMTEEPDLKSCCTEWYWRQPRTLAAVGYFYQNFLLLGSELQDVLTIRKVSFAQERLEQTILVYAQTSWSVGLRCFFAKTYTARFPAKKGTFLQMLIIDPVAQRQLPGGRGGQMPPMPRPGPVVGGGRGGSNAVARGSQNTAM